MTVGIICEYNPLHIGHKKQIDRIRETFGDGVTIVCAMSGNFVQRGAPAILEKSCRARAAIVSGADLVLELPVTTSLSSAEGFAAGGVSILGKFCDYLCFGAETADGSALLHAAQAQLSADFPPLLRQPNNILGMEYCKAILSQGCAMKPFPIHRQGSYHAEIADSENPSATAVRNLMLTAYNWKSCVPKQAREIFAHAPLHTIAAGERAILAKLRTMNDAEFEALPYGSEGLWRKFMHACREEATLEEIVTATKSKRYTRTRIQRMVMCAFLGITREILEAEVPYTRVLAFNGKGREILRAAKKEMPFRNLGEKTNHPYFQLEQQWGSLYGLFRTDTPEAPDMEARQRIYYQK